MFQRFIIKITLYYDDKQEKNKRYKEVCYVLLSARRGRGNGVLMGKSDTERNVDMNRKFLTKGVIFPCGIHPRLEYAP